MSSCRSLSGYAILLCMITAGCVYSHSTLLDPGRVYPPIQPHLVRIILDPAELDGLEYDRIAIINSTGDSWWSNENQLYESIRKEAAKIGANAVFLPTIDQPSATAEVFAVAVGHLLGPSRRGEAIALRIMGPKQESRPSARPMQPMGVDCLSCHR